MSERLERASSNNKIVTEKLTSFLLLLRHLFLEARHLLLLAYVRDQFG